MLTYEETMNQGTAEWAPVLTALAEAGLPATFTQTGGMNAALDVNLEGGYYLLITDGQEPLTWHRADLDAWGVGLYRGDDAGDGPLAFDETADVGVDALLALVQRVLGQWAKTHRG
jgi:hypothetical protein